MMEMMVTESWRLNALEDADDSHDPEDYEQQVLLGARRLVGASTCSRRCPTRSCGITSSL
jgi:hypothetical protein